MKYILDNKSDSINSITELDLKGLEIKFGKLNPLKTDKILLVDEELKILYIKQNLNKKLIEIVSKMELVLEDNESGDDETALVLGEVQRLKGIVVNKYKEHMKSSEYKAFLQRLIYTEEEFQRKFNSRQIYKEMMMESVYENKGKGR